MARRDREDLKQKSFTSREVSRLPEELLELDFGKVAIIEGKAFMRVEDEVINNKDNKFN